MCLRVRSIDVPNIGDQVWLITSKHTEPDLNSMKHQKLETKEIEGKGGVQFVNVWMEDLVHESDTW